MTTDSLPVAYRGGNKREAEVRYLGISSDEDKQFFAEQTRNEPSDEEVAKPGK